MWVQFWVRDGDNIENTTYGKNNFEQNWLFKIIEKQFLTFFQRGINSTGCFSNKKFLSASRLLKEIDENSSIFKIGQKRRKFLK